MDYEDKLTDEELEELLSSEEEGEDTLLSKLFIMNSELMEVIFDLQEFLEDNGMTRQQFLDWKQQQKMRIYH